LFTATGFQGYTGDPLTDYMDLVEVLDIDDFPQLPCFYPEQFPIGTYGGVGIFHEEQVIKTAINGGGK